MSLLNLSALAWSAMAIPIIALYILRIRRRRQVVPTLMFWDQIFQDTRPRSLWRTLRHWLSLLMQLAFLMLLVLALADPIWSAATRKPVHYVLVLDQSASMQATDGSPTRFDDARSFAHRTIRSMRDQDQATIIAAGVQASIACGRTYHQPTLHGSVDDLHAVDAPAALADAVRLAGSIAVDRQERRIIVITDAGGEAELEGIADFGFRIADSDTRASSPNPQSAIRNPQWLVERCGGDTDNLAITGFAVRPRADNPVELQGILRVANFTDAPANVEVRLRQDGELFDVVAMELAAGQEDQRTFYVVHTGAKTISAQLTADDALPVDNTAVAVLPSVEKKNIVLVSTGNFFLEGVLAAHPWMTVQRVAPEDADRAVTDADIVVYDEHVPQALPHKPCLFIHPSGDTELWALGDVVNNPLVSEVAEDSELLKHVNLRNVTFHRARAVTAKQPGRQVLASFEHPLLVSWAAASPPVVLFAVDIRQSDLPWRTAFPILMQNTLNYLAGQTEDPVSTYPTGRTATVSLAGNDVDVQDTKGRPIPFAREQDRIEIGPVASAGLVHVKGPKREIDLAFNLTDNRESDLRLPTPATQPAEENVASLHASRFAWPWWVVLVIAAIGLSTLEWCLHQRRVVD